MTDVSLREYIEQKVCALDKRIDQRFIALEKALELQAKEYERRLEALNGEQARIAKSNAMNLPRETYAADRKDKAAMWFAICSLVVAVLTLIAVMPKGA